MEDGWFFPIFTFTLINTNCVKNSLENSPVDFLELWNNNNNFTKKNRHKILLALSNTSLSDHRLISTNFNFFRGARIFACYFFNAQENNGDFFRWIELQIIFSLIYILSSRIALFDWEIDWEYFLSGVSSMWKFARIIFPVSFKSKKG
jgi:hypothetical protein